MSDVLTLEPGGEATHGACADCGATTRSVWGFISNRNGARATYFIRWTDGHLDRGAELLVSIGCWGAGSLPANRVAFGLDCQLDTTGPAFMLVDAEALPWGTNGSLGKKLTRSAALADPLKAE